MIIRFLIEELQNYNVATNQWRLLGYSFIGEGVKCMNVELEITQTKQNIENYKQMLQLMPKNTALGRMCITAYLRKEERKLQNLLKNSK